MLKDVTNFTAEHDRAMRIYYDERADQYDEWYLSQGSYAKRPDREGWATEVAELTARVKRFGSGQILEVAPGTGWWTQHLARNGTLVAVDFALRMLEQTRGRLAAHHLDAALIRGDAYSLPFRDGAFDSCFFGFWLSHVPRSRTNAFLAEVRRVLKPGAPVMAADSAAAIWESGDSPKPGSEYLDQRRLNDGSQYQVLKIFHSPETMSLVLAPIGAVIESAVVRKDIVYAVVRRD
ncbi:MAG: class I SAM-dependent methyltransferase [Candidatus Binataceae bacterium]